MVRGIETHGGIPILPLDTIIEATFTDWEIYNIYESGLPADEDDIITIRDDGAIFLFDDSTNNSFIISKDGVILSTLINRFLFPVYWAATLVGRYVMSLDIGLENIAIHDGGVELWRRDPNQDRGEYVLNAAPITGLWMTGISPRGEWVIVPVTEAVTLNMLIFIYKGVAG